MRRLIFRWLSGMITVSLLSLAGAAGQHDNSTAVDQPELAGILAHCADYCRKLENAVLDFICQEKIREEIFRPSIIEVETRNKFTQEKNQAIVSQRVARNEFVYDYQLIRKEGETSERRNLVLENGRKTDEKNAQLKTSGCTYENIIFSPIVLLGEKWQPKHDYKVLREENVLGKRALVIQVTPKPDEWLGYLYGTVWVAQEDSAILKIEWAQESIGNYGEFELAALNLGIKPDIILSGDYSYQKNGIRFPSAFSVSVACRFTPKRETTLYKLAVAFAAYKFFTVETEVKY
jgi:hypothetical protein